MKWEKKRNTSLIFLPFYWFMKYNYWIITTFYFICHWILSHWVLQLFIYVLYRIHRFRWIPIELERQFSEKTAPTQWASTKNRFSNELNLIPLQAWPIASTHWTFARKKTPQTSPSINCSYAAECLFVKMRKKKQMNQFDRCQLQFLISENFDFY